MKKIRKISLIISTYNWPESLKLSLLAVARQTMLPDEVIVADDGSGQKTIDLVKQMQQEMPFPLIHVWHEDKGFRAGQIRNKAIAKASGDYIIQIDGDVIPEKHFVADHIRLAERRYFIAGSRANIDERLTRKVLEMEKINLTPFTRGVRNTFNALRFPLITFYFLFRYRKKHAYYARGCNMSFWRDEFIAVNGYNEDLEGWGKEDSELVVRMINTGIIRKFIKFAGIVYHLHHIENSRNSLNINTDMYEKAIKEKHIYCSNGINKYL